MHAWTLITEHCAATSVGAENNHNPTSTVPGVRTRTQAGLVERSSRALACWPAATCRVGRGGPVDHSALAPGGRRGHGSGGVGKSERAGSWRLWAAASQRRHLHSYSYHAIFRHLCWVLRAHGSFSPWLMCHQHRARHSPSDLAQRACLRYRSERAAPNTSGHSPT